MNATSFAVALGAIVLLGALVRIAAAQGELWLDEIWSYRLAHLASGVGGIFTQLHNDNNHYLNTLFLRFVPEGTASWWIYRLPALVFGTGSVLLAALIARRRSRPAALAAAVLTAGSFPLIVYSSEARGYAIAVFFAFACVLATDRYLATRNMGWGALSGVCAVAGLLGHLTFLHALAGIAAWIVVRGAMAGPRRVLIDAGVVLLLPAAALIWLYVYDLQHLQVGGGPLTSPGDIAANALSLAVGGPDDGGWKVAATLAAFAAAVGSIAAVHRSGSDLWVLFLVTVIVAPAATLMVVDTGVIYERYLLVALAFMTLSFAWLLDRLAFRSMWLATALLVIFLLASALRSWEFIDLGRSQYRAALQRIVQQSADSLTTVGSDHDFRNGRLVEFYRPFVPGAERIRYEMQGEWSAGGPDWLLIHRIEPDFDPRPEITVAGGYRYRLVQAYPYAGVSGWHLALYQNVRQGP